MNWTEVDGIAAAAAAIGTLVLAAFTAGLAHRTHELAGKAEEQVEVAGKQVEAALEQVQATQTEAQATESLARAAREDRQLAWRPKLDLRHVRWVMGGAWEVGVRNSGGGPAQGVVVAGREMSNINNWFRHAFGDLMSGQEDAVRIQPWPHGGCVTSIFEGFSALESDPRRVVIGVALCSDALGRRHRFGVAAPKNPYPGEPTIALPIETSDPPHTTQWALEPLIWG